MAWWSQISETVTHGLQITVVGMALVFFTLGLVILSVVLLTRLPGSRMAQEPEKKQEPGASLQPESTNPDLETDHEDLAQVAAIALALLRSRRPAGARPQRNPVESAWKQYGRASQLGL